MEQTNSSKKPGFPKRTWTSIQSKFPKWGKAQPNEIIDTIKREREELIKNIQEKWDDFLKQGLEFPSDDDKIINSINIHIFFTRNHFHQIGHIDGSIPSRDYSIYTLTFNQATMLVEHVCTKLQERIELMKLKISAIEDKYSRLIAEQQNWLTFNEDTTAFYQKNYQYFSKATAWLCVLVGSLLIIADLPLSLSLAGYFDIGGLHKSDDYNADFIGKATDIELILFSLGIALSTIYIKIYYDEYVSNRLGTFSAMVISRDTGNNLRIISPKVEFYFKLAIKTIALIGVIAMLIYLGYFRNMYANFAPAAEMEIGKSIFTSDETIHVRLISYILITVIIPVVSGVALSTGFSIFHNRNIQTMIQKQLDVFKQQLASIEAEKSVCYAKKKEFENAHENWENKDHKISTIATEYAGFYESGYNQAFRKYFGNDLFKQVSVARNELMSLLLKGKVNAILNSSK